MNTTITVNDGTDDTTEPAAVDGFNAQNEGRTIVHRIIGGGIALALIAPDPATGTLALVYTSEALAEAGRQLHLRRSTYTMTNTDVPTVGMTYAVTGVGRVLTADVGKWQVDVSFQEVA